jgi:hypothetical protein
MPPGARCTGSGLQASSSALPFATSANGVMQRGAPEGTLSLLLQISHYFPTSNGPATAQESILHAGIRVASRRSGAARPHGIQGAALDEPARASSGSAPGMPRGSLGEVDGMPHPRPPTQPQQFSWLAIPEICPPGEGASRFGTVTVSLQASRKRRCLRLTRLAPRRHYRAPLGGPTRET